MRIAVVIDAEMVNLEHGMKVFQNAVNDTRESRRRIGITDNQDAHRCIGTHFPRRRPHRYFNNAAASSANYVSTPSAPARLKQVRLSIMARSWSSQPFCAAALIIEYSPLT